MSSAADKLDKLPWAEVKLEMTEEKGLNPGIVDKIGEYAPPSSSLLKHDAPLMANPSAKQGLSDISVIFSLLNAYGIIERISFDMSLARGLDYYTDIIYEAIVEASAPPGLKATNTFASGPSSESTASPAATGSKQPKSRPKTTDGADEEIFCGAAGVTPNHHRRHLPVPLEQGWRTVPFYIRLLKSLFSSPQVKLRNAPKRKAAESIIAEHSKTTSNVQSNVAFDCL
ncbi:unnamed protein product [Cyclocybe aegerita]|uniref:Uncharacterized protein n=1 Tax=Cyclocybe aegerita TaxID=1973307 RepID=A0A8S0XZJ3_CYCAE|nr:unnamed protein product [Cyclocybe aegerita]